MKFADRYAAGRQLAAKLAHLKDRAPVVLALPRGGVAVGFEIAQALGVPLDIVLVRFARRQVVLAERNDGARLRALGALGILRDKTHFIAYGELFEPAIRDAVAVEGPIR